MVKIVKYTVALIALPSAVAVSRSFYEELFRINYFAANMNMFLWGIVLYMLFHILIIKPMFLYTWGHEVIHVLATWVCGGHVTSFHVGEGGGSVATSKTNVFIELSPYFIPTYTLLLVVAMPLFGFKNTPVFIQSAYIFLIGFSLGMHLIMTAVMMKTKQPDIVKSGYAFSLVLIYIANLIIVFLLFALLSKEVTLKYFFLKSWLYTKDIYLVLFRRFF